jgi:uncharacterized protein YcbK (DUF882 family)
MEQDFLDVMDDIRRKARIPLVINCAFRSREYDKKKGRTGNSAHTQGLAVDIRCNASENRFKIVKAALECGITRIGIGKTFIHIDMGERVGLPANVIWHYYE